MRRTAILFLSLAVVVSGCSQILGSQSPEEQFTSQVADMTSSEYHVTYDIETQLSGLGGVISGSVQNPELYSNGENSKMVVDVAGMTFAAYGLFQNRTTTCSDGSLFSITNDTGVSCSVSNTGSVDFQEQLDEVNITRNGTRTAADRECNMYVLRSNEELNASGVPDTATEYSDGTLNLCLDKEKGYPAIVEMKSETEQSELRSDGSSTQSISITATSYDGTVSDESMEVPVDVATSFTCEPYQLNITTFDYSGQTTVSVNGINRTLGLEDESTETLDLSTDQRESGTNTAKVYAGEEVKEATCYQLGSYDFGETDYNFSDY